LRRFALRDAANEDAGILALLECYERGGRAFYLELPPQADPWELPFVLHEFAQQGEPTVDARWSLKWVQSRLVPTERQNLGEVLRVNGLDAYDELRLLELTGGRCSQDDCYLVPMENEQLPAWYVERMALRALDVYPLERFRLLVSFRDGATMLCDMQKNLARERSFARVLNDEDVFCRATAQPGGHGVRWGTMLAVASNTLRERGRRVALSASDIAVLARQAVVDTAEVARLLECSRQNVSDLVRRGKLVPLKTSPRGPLFLRSDIYQRLDS